MMLALRAERKTPHGQGKTNGKGKGRLIENTHASAMKRTRRESPPPLARRKPPKRGRYILWSLAVLRKVCLHRGIKGQQRNNDKDAMVKLLERMDQKAGGRVRILETSVETFLPLKVSDQKLPLPVQQGASAVYCYDMSYVQRRAYTSTDTW